MNPALEEAIKEAYTVAPATQVILHTLEIRQTGVQDSIFITQSALGFSALDEESVSHYYTPCGFQFSLPPSNEEGFQSLNVAIDNIDRTVSDFINAAKSERQVVEMIYRPYLSDDLTQPQMNPPLLLYLKDIKVNEQVTGRATFMDLTNKHFPSELYTRVRFPTLG